MTPTLDKKSLDYLLATRRDVRDFKPDPVSADILLKLMIKANMAPSVGLSQPWRFVFIDKPQLRWAIQEDFEHSKKVGEDLIPVFRQSQYRRTKLSGLKEAPVQIAVFTDTKTHRGYNLGIKTMPEALEYSTVMAIHTLWLAARAEGIGLGWVSILNPDRIKRLVCVPDQWKFTAYLCMGYPAVSEQTQPELEAVGWETRVGDATHLFHTR